MLNKEEIQKMSDELKKHKKDQLVNIALGVVVKLHMAKMLFDFLIERSDDEQKEMLQQLVKEIGL